jgi:hypothetical protein
MFNIIKVCLIFVQAFEEELGEAIYALECEKAGKMHPQRRTAQG